MMNAFFVWGCGLRFSRARKLSSFTGVQSDNRSLFAPMLKVVNLYLRRGQSDPNDDP
jgi:hypothetical protein